MELALSHKKRMLQLEFETAQKKARLETERMESENIKLAADAAAAEQVVRAAAERSRLEEERMKNENATAAEMAKLEEEKSKSMNSALAVMQKAEAQQKQEEVHEEFRRLRASTISVNLDALRALRPERGTAPMSPRSMLRVEDELRTGLLGKERPDPELGRPMYCSKFLKDELLLTEHAAKERAKVFGNDVKEVVRLIYPNYDLNARTNRIVDGREREPHLYFEAHLPAFQQALQNYLARASPVCENELSREGQTRRREESATSRRVFFCRAAV